MKHLKYLLTLLLSLTMGICFAQNRNKVKPAHRTTISKAPTIVKERTYTLTPIQQLQKYCLFLHKASHHASQKKIVIK